MSSTADILTLVLMSVILFQVTLVVFVGRLAGSMSDVPVASHYFVILLKCSVTESCNQQHYDSLAFVLPQWYTPGSSNCRVCI